MDKCVLRTKNLSVTYQSNENVKAVHNVSLELNQGESVGLIGESGSGKSTLALSIMGLLSNQAKLSGEIEFNGVNLLHLSEKEINMLRWKKIAIVFQNSLDILNPVLTVGEQIKEAIERHSDIKGIDAQVKVKELIEMVGLESVWAKAYPHQISGGMRQKILIAMAISCSPEVLLVDEPTMALDSVAKNEIVKLLLKLQKEQGFSMLVISHELPIISALTTRLLVMYAGNIFEEGDTKEVINEPFHPYTRGLIYSSPAINPYGDMWGIPGILSSTNENQCPFFNRCNQGIELCLKNHPFLEKVGEDRYVSCLRGGIVTMLKGTKISKGYNVQHREITACNNCNIEIKAGEVVALIGESGSGKTTLAEILSGITIADEGEVFFEGRKVIKNSETSKKNGIQIVFQDPLSSINEHLKIGDIVREPLDINKSETMLERIEKVKIALESVSLPSTDDFLERKGHTLSGGQRQRLAIARALVMEPKLLIADEISSMLDPSTGANILRLLKKLQNRKGFSMLYITHDLALAQKISDKIYVMRNGNIIEHGSITDVFRNPKEEYTGELIRSAGAF